MQKVMTPANWLGLRNLNSLEPSENLFSLNIKLSV